MVTDGCSGMMDYLTCLINKYIRQVGYKKLSFTGCCDEHDLFYEQGGNKKDRAFADKVLYNCIKSNLLKRNRPKHVCVHVPFLFWLGVRLFGWMYWSKTNEIQFKR